MVEAPVLRGMGVGALAGLLPFVVARFFAETVIRAAVDHEGARDAEAAIATVQEMAPLA